MRRFPWLTLLVAGVTVVGLVVQETVPGTLQHLERTPAALHGEVWRWVTSLVVQDGHVAGGVFNLLGLLLCGTAAEQVVGRRTWLVAYLGAGLVGQVFGQLWQPVGGGSSVAVCGLAAVCAVALLRPAPRDRLVVVAPLVWTAALLSALWQPLSLIGVLLAVLLAGPLRERRHTGHVVVAVVLVAGVLLLLTRDLHGGALTVALLAVLLVARAVPSASLDHRRLVQEKLNR